MVVEDEHLPRNYAFMGSTNHNLKTNSHAYIQVVNKVSFKESGIDMIKQLALLLLLLKMLLRWVLTLNGIVDT